MGDVAAGGPEGAGLCSRNLPVRVIPGPEGGFPGGRPWTAAAPPWSGGRLAEPAAYPRPGSAKSAASWPCPPAGPPETSLSRAKGYLPTPWLPHPNCPPVTPLPAPLPLQLPPPTVALFHSKHSPPTVLPNATAKCQPLPSWSPRPSPPGWAPGPCIPDLPSRQKLSHTCCVPGRGWCQAGAESWGGRWWWAGQAGAESWAARVVGGSRAEKFGSQWLLHCQGWQAGKGGLWATSTSCGLYG